MSLNMLFFLDGVYFVGVFSFQGNLGLFPFVLNTVNAGIDSL